MTFSLHELRSLMLSNILFHGTCLKNAKRILLEGFDGNQGEQIWTVSGGYNYFWSLKDVAREERNDTRYSYYEARHRAQFAAETSVIQNDCSHMVIFEVLPYFDYSPDTSCSYMEGAVCSYDTVSPELIARIWISQNVTYFKPFMLNYGSQELRISPDVSKELEIAAQAVENCEFFPNEYIELEEISKEEILNL